MVINWKTEPEDNPTIPPRMRAAEYVRMSTEHQQYSTDNQAVAIRAYAKEHGYEIVRTYQDEGKSGLNLAGRSGLKRLLADIEAGRTDFRALLVYDVSRLGRFQDPDEAASHELRIRAAGIQVEYCGEQFRNDGSVSSSIIKTVKRTMAAEYSRELSVKVFAGQANLIRRGYRQGGPAGYGLRRLLVDVNGEPKGELGRGEHKSIATDRVILVPGPADEVFIVHEIYRLFTECRKTEREIAELLNARELVTDLGRPWTRGTIHQVLINEKYVGDNVWARTSFKLKQQHVQNEEQQWIRAEGAFSAIISRPMFAAARAIIDARSERLSDAAMLEMLTSIFESRGMLSGLIIDEAEGTPSSSAYRSRFGGLLRAYELVGFAPDRNYRYLEINRKLRALHPTIVTDTVAALERAGGTIAHNPDTDLLTVNDEFTASLVVVRCVETAAGSLRWKLRLDSALKPDMTVAVRMDPGNELARDYYLLPRLDISEATLRLCEHNGLSLDAYRFDDLSAFHRMATRRAWRYAA
ncbi:MULTISPECIES: recombinase family protein [unclassified Sphingomonas]|jgi:DNA invertase Pin-like site-specific DNA recombinase|uniref:recombinase family protein n=1 Tax=unclassified Sphingomonas TaxID=196159 RepID=UPI0008367528|nr:MULTISPECIES: recombinase family protein [unclassified Sphingomonas]